jgi:hypothetical protein
MRGTSAALLKVIGLPQSPCSLQGTLVNFAFARFRQLFYVTLFTCNVAGINLSECIPDFPTPTPIHHISLRNPGSGLIRINWGSILLPQITCQIAQKRKPWPLPLQATSTCEPEL